MPCYQNLTQVWYLQIGLDYFKNLNFEIEYCVLLLTERLFGSILLNEKGVVIFIMTEFFAPFYRVSGASKSFVEKLIPILGFIP